MPLIKGQLNRLAEMLDAESTDEQFNEQINSINTWLGLWNSNLEVLNRAKTIAAANNLISELTWPFEEPPASQSPS